MGVSAFNRARSINLMHKRSTGVTIPLAASLLSVTAGDTENDLSWTDNSNDEEEFVIFRGTDGVSFVEIDTVIADVTTYNDQGLSNGQIYYYYIVARNSAGDSDASNTASGTPLPSLNTDLVEFWKLADTRGVNGNTFTNNNSTTFTSGKVGNAGTFVAASTQSLHVPTKVWGVGNAWSVSSWHKSTSTGGCIWQIGDDLANPSGSVHSSFKFESSYVYGSNNAGNIFKHYNGITDSTGVWLHTVVTWDGTNLKVYRDGADITAGLGKPTDNAGTMSDLTRKFRLGAADNVVIQSPHNGQIDAVGLWSRAITAAEVTTLYNAGTGMEYPFFTDTVNATFYSSFADSVNATWGGGSLQGVAYNGAAITNGKLDLKGGTNKYIEYGGIGNAEMPNIGTIRVTYTPNYSGAPSADRPIVTICDSTTSSAKSTRFYHTNAGDLAISITNDAGATVVSVANLAAWSPVAGTSYIFEFDYDITTGATRLFLDGVQQGATQTGTATRVKSLIRCIRVGASNSAASSTADGEFSNLVLFSTVQHTANHSAVYSYPTFDGNIDTPGRIVPSTLEAWYEPHFLEQADASAVATLSDASGRANHLTQSTAGLRPAVDSAILNSKDIMVCASDWIGNTTSPALASADYDFFILLKCLNGNLAVMFQLGTQSGTPDAISIYQNSGLMTLYQDGGGLLTTTAPNLGTTDWKLIRLKRTSNTYYMFVDGVATTAASVAGNAIAATGLTLGAWSDGGFPFSGSVAFAAAWRGNLTAGQLTSLHDYLDTRFGTTLP